jgi:uncharacterized protein involved in type VI secretion and phage assembly
VNTQYFGKYRGIVSDIQDPSMQGRIKARVPDVFGSDESGWALSCFPFAGGGMGLVGLPKVGSGVWIEFEQGDPEYPIWTGCWFGAASDAPSQALTAPYNKIVLQTDGGNKITLDDTPGAGGITLETSAGQKITLTSQGVTIDDGQGGKVAMQGPQVSINDGALQVV